MNIWLVQTGESLPISNQARQLRTGLLADLLVKRGHDVLWWASSFDHYKLDWVCRGDSQIRISDRFRIQCLAGNAYKKHISLARFIDHRRISWKFRSLAPSIPQPDLIVASTPAYDLAYQVARYAKVRSIPLVVDIRDPWPDIFMDHVPKAIKPIARLFLAAEFGMMRYLCETADALVAVTNTFLALGLTYARRDRSVLDRVFYLGCKPLPTGNLEESPRIAELKRLCNGKFVVVFVGTFGKYHNPEILIDVARRFEERGIRFVIAGDGENRKALERRALGMDHVVFPGWLNEHEISMLLEFCHVGVCSTPHSIDLFPNKGFLYFSAGLPVLNAFRGDLKRWVDEEGLGYSYEPGDINSLASYIRELASNEGMYSRMSGCVKSSFAKSFSSDVIYREYANYLESLPSELKNLRPVPTFANA